MKRALLVAVLVLVGCGKGERDIGAAKPLPGPAKPVPAKHWITDEGDEEALEIVDATRLGKMRLAEVKPYLGKRIVLTGRVAEVRGLKAKFFQTFPGGWGAELPLVCVFAEDTPPLGLERHQNASLEGKVTLLNGVVTLVDCKLN